MIAFATWLWIGMGSAFAYDADLFPVPIEGSTYRITNAEPVGNYEQQLHVFTSGMACRESDIRGDDLEACLGPVRRGGGRDRHRDRPRW